MHYQAIFIFQVWMTISSLFVLGNGIVLGERELLNVMIFLELVPNYCIEQQAQLKF